MSGSGTRVAAPSCVLHRAHERCAEADATVTVIDPQVADEEPAPVGVTGRSSDEALVLPGGDGKRPVLLGRCDQVVGRHQVRDDLGNGVRVGRVQHEQVDGSIHGSKPATIAESTRECSARMAFAPLAIGTYIGAFSASRCSVSLSPTAIDDRARSRRADRRRHGGQRSRPCAPLRPQWRR
jgi:hypothetical protein